MLQLSGVCPKIHKSESGSTVFIPLFLSFLHYILTLKDNHVEIDRLIHERIAGKHVIRTSI